MSNPKENPTRISGPTKKVLERAYRELVPEEERSNVTVVKRRPEWIRGKLPSPQLTGETHSIVRRNRLFTVCEEAHCPNLGECWQKRHATIMILGDTCTRSCGFCAVKTGKPNELDRDEPRRVGDAAKELRLKHLVITSVNRDELLLGGADIFAETIRQVREKSPETRIEVLTPDFKGYEPALKILFDARPDIFNHNIETVPRLYDIVRPQAKYQRSLEVLKAGKEAGLITKSGLMVGLGETEEEIYEVLRDLRAVGVDMVTIGQYLQPTKNHLPVIRFVHPDEFKRYETYGYELGFGSVASGPMVRSSYNAEEFFERSSVKILLENHRKR
ncbi:MAG: lipoyl synthase [bacterium]|nr:lipoyl synthase [bacterium]